MGNNNYIKQRHERDREMLAAGLNMGMQIVADYFQIALRDPDVMGKDTFGRNRIERINNKTLELDDYFNPAFSDDVEAERYQEEMDRLLREIWGKDLVPFRERYPSLKTIKYNKARKNWV
jgi:hypothetical protein